MSGWVKFPNTWAEQDDIEALGSDAAMLHVSAVSYSGRQTTDGHIPTRALRRLWPVESIEESVERLVDAGLWEVIEGGYQVTSWQTHLLSSSEVEKRRKQSAETSERYRRHKAGDHTMCDRCAVVKSRRDAVSDNVTDDVSDSVSDDPRLGSARNGSETRVESRGGRPASAGPSARAPGTASPAAEGEKCPHGHPGGLVFLKRFAVPTCGECLNLAIHSDDGNVGPAGIAETFDAARTGQLRNFDDEEWDRIQETDPEGHEAAFQVSAALCEFNEENGDGEPEPELLEPIAAHVYLRLVGTPHDYIDTPDSGLDDGAMCLVCGRPESNNKFHHIPAHTFADDGSGITCVCQLPEAHPVHQQKAAS